MRNVVATLGIVVTATQVGLCSLQSDLAMRLPDKSVVPAFALTSGQTKTIEWGCPIDQERREETSRKSILTSLVSECMEQVRQAAAQKPNVSGVIRTAVIAPDVTFLEMPDGSRIVNGTIFLQTIVAMTQAAQ